MRLHPPWDGASGWASVTRGMGVVAHDADLLGGVGGGGGGGGRSSRISPAAVFLLKKVPLAVCIAAPTLYMVHLLLLSFYARFLGVYPGPHAQYGPTPPRHGGFFDHPPPLPPLHDHGPLVDGPRLPFYGGAELADQQAHTHFPRPHLDREPERAPDVSNTFATYLHADECRLDSRDLHLAYTPLCRDKHAALDAMSWGGRAGFDQPFIPLGCDFRWYTTAEICAILDRFSHVFIVGDSLQRMIVTALYMLLREDVGYGGVAEWAFEPSPWDTDDAIKKVSQCKCEHQFNKHECSHAPVRRYKEAMLKSEPARKPACARYLPPAAAAGDNDTALPFDISYHEIQKYPASDEELKKLVLDLPKTRPAKPFAFIMHHTFWNDVNMTATTAWIDQLTERFTSHFEFLPRPWAAYYYPPETTGFPRLFVTANAAGVMKNAAYLDTQNSGAIARFEAALHQHLAFRQVEMLGFFNMSVQTTSSDGTHANMRTNLVKAMMIVNWLDWVGKEEGAHWNAESSPPS